MLTKRNVLIGAAAIAAGAALPVARDRAAARETARPSTVSGVRALAIDIAERPTALPCFGGKTLPLWTFGPGEVFPVVRMRLGEHLETHVKNSLTRPGEHVTIHWHGLRIPNEQDGVPYMTQAPIMPSEEGRYAFVPPDTGTFFFHTHCNSVEHFGRGLVGALIVEGDETEPADAELVLMMKDWRLGPDGAFLPFMTDEGAAKAGTAGTVRSINGVTKPQYDVPAAADVRIRFLNVDATRVSEIGIEGGEAAIIAIDGNPCAPVPLVSWRLGPAQRLDILLRTPQSGQTVKLVDYFSKSPVILAEFAAKGAAKKQTPFRATSLRIPAYERADIANAERLKLDFSATATGEAVAAFSDVAGIPIGALCLTKRTFWAINKQAWPGSDHKDLGPPLATLKSGRSYVIELNNRTPHPHPVHLHGHTFEVLSSSLRQLPPFRADTVMLLPKERIEIAFVAGLPGRWMLHCHILEHQEAGMMGYITVT